jgi:hypothetical protein
MPEMKTESKEPPIAMKRMSFRSLGLNDKFLSKPKAREPERSVSPLDLKLALVPDVADGLHGTPKTTKSIKAS